MSEPHLILTCTLADSNDCTAVQGLLQQYGLRADHVGGALVARGVVPPVLARMRSGDIELHLAARIEDAAPGTRVKLIRATFSDRRP